MATRDVPALVKQLREYTTCDVSDALCKLGQSFGGFLPGITMWSPERQAGKTKIVGPAYTVEFVELNDSRPKLKQHYIDLIPKGSIIFISCPNNSINASFGGLMSKRALISGSEGAVINGRFRDLEEQRDLKMPIFAKDVGISPPYGELKVIATNVPVIYEFNQNYKTIIHPGDIIMADLNGVTVIPQKDQDKIIPLMQKSVEADEKVAKELDQGMLFAEAVKLHRG